MRAQANIHIHKQSARVSSSRGVRTCTVRARAAPGKGEGKREAFALCAYLAQREERELESRILAITSRKERCTSCGSTDVHEEQREEGVNAEAFIARATHVEEDANVSTNKQGHKSEEPTQRRQEYNTHAARL